jgi:hypothetical protein
VIFLQLRFNSELQEEDIHMFPTAPPTGQAAIARKGILKTHRSGGNTQRTNSVNRGHNPFASHSKGVVEDLEYSHGKQHHNSHNPFSVSKGGPGNNFDSSSGNDSEDKDDRDNSSVGSKDSRDGPYGQTAKQLSLQQQQQQMQMQRHQQLLQQQQMAARSKGSQQAQPQSQQQAGSRRPNSADRGSGSQEDLYQFIGLGAPGSGSSSAIRSSQQLQQQQQYQQQGSSQPVKPVAGKSSEGMTVEDRLLKLVSEMQVGGGSAGGDGQYGRSAGRAPVNSRDFERDSAMENGKQVYKEVSSHPTLYDLANMHMSGGGGTPGYGNPSASSGNSRAQLQRTATGQDPLAAFEMMQQGGAIRVRHDLVPGQRTFANPGGAPGREVRGAWMENEQGPSSSSRRPASPSTASSAAPQLSGQAPKTYRFVIISERWNILPFVQVYDVYCRHGSPAPNRMARSGPATGQPPASPAGGPGPMGGSTGGGVGTRGAWTGSGSSVASVGGNSVMSGSSAGSRGYPDRPMPTGSGNKDMPG